jgi:hypothetical protein
MGLDYFGLRIADLGYEMWDFGFQNAKYATETHNNISQLSFGLPPFGRVPGFEIINSDYWLLCLGLKPIVFGVRKVRRKIK